MSGNFAGRFSEFQEFATFEKFESGAVSHVRRYLASFVFSRELRDLSGRRCSPSFRSCEFQSSLTCDRRVPP